MFKLPDHPRNLKSEYIEQYGEKEARRKLRNLIKAQKQNPLKYFCPNQVQERAINETAEAMQESPISTILLTCGNGVGKTLLSLQIIGNLIYGSQNEWFNYSGFRNCDFPRSGWLITSPTNLDENYFNESSEVSFYSIFNDKEIRPEKEGKQHINSVYFDDANFKLSIKTFNQAPSEFESVTLGFVIIDEPCPQNIWNKIPSRLRGRGGLILMPMTPLDVDPYVINEVIERADMGVKGYRHIVGSSTDVTTDKERGHYNKNTLLSQMERMDKDSIDSRIHGQITHFRERIYNDLDKDVHFVAPDEYPLKQNYLYFHVVDPHDSRPNAEIWAAYTPNGRWIIFDERPEDKTTDFWKMRGGEDVESHKHAIEFKELSLKEFLGFPLNPKRIIDRHFAEQTRGARKKTLKTEYKEIGLRFTSSYKANNEIEFGHKKVRRTLRYLSDGKPGLVIWNHCKHTWSGLRNYIKKRKQTKSDMDRPAGEGKIIEKYKDFPDTIRMLVCHNVKFEKGTNYQYEPKESALDYV